jgi:hypothetical protein
MHRGDIKVASNTDPAKGPTGTSFTVSVPRRRQDTTDQTSTFGLTGTTMPGVH